MRRLLGSFLLLFWLNGCAPPPPLVSQTQGYQLTATEQRVQEIITERGYHVVHFWAPWCHNSMHELRAGWWDELVDENPDVTFTFVTFRNEGLLSAETLQRYDIPDRVVRLVQPGPTSRDDQTPRDRLFLGLPVTWTPTTWIFHRNGQLAYAINYGEVTKPMMEELLAGLSKEW